MDMVEKDMGGKSLRHRRIRLRRRKAEIEKRATDHADHADEDINAEIQRKEESENAENVSKGENVRFLAGKRWRPSSHGGANLPE